MYPPGISEIERWGNKSRSGRARLRLRQLARELLMGMDVDLIRSLKSQDTLINRMDLVYDCH